MNRGSDQGSLEENTLVNLSAEGLVALKHGHWPQAEEPRGLRKEWVLGAFCPGHSGTKPGNKMNLSATRLCLVLCEPEIVGVPAAMDDSSFAIRVPFSGHSALSAIRPLPGNDQGPESCIYECKSRLRR